MDKPQGFNLAIGPVVAEQLKLLLEAKIYGSSLAAVASTLISHGIQKAVDFEVVDAADLKEATRRAFAAAGEGTNLPLGAFAKVRPAEPRVDLLAFVCTCSPPDLKLLVRPCPRCKGGEVLLQGRQRHAHSS